MSEGELYNRIIERYGNKLDIFKGKSLKEILDEAKKDFPACRESYGKGIQRGINAVDNIINYLAAIDSWREKWFGD